MLESEAEVASLKPDISSLASLGALNVSCFAGTGERYKTRMFAPGIGLTEDPATGSAAGPLALHLALRGRIGSVSGSRSPKASRSAGRRCCTRVSTAALRRSSALVSAAALSSSRAAPTV